jgi:hypothetical protein
MSAPAPVKRPGQHGPHLSHKGRVIALVIGVLVAVSAGLMVVGGVFQARASQQTCAKLGCADTAPANTAPANTAPAPRASAPTDQQPTPASSISFDANGNPVKLSDRLREFDSAKPVYTGLSTTSRRGDIAAAFVANWNQFQTSSNTMLLYGLTENPNNRPGSIAEFLHQGLTENFPVNVEDVPGICGTDCTISMEVSLKDSPGYNRTPITVQFHFADDAHPLAMSIVTPSQTYVG